MVWAPGQSGNPAGRKKGSRNHATRIAQELLDGEAEALARKVIEQALQGDVTCLRVCLERLVAPRRDSPIQVSLPRAKAASDLPGVLSRITQLVATGELTPSEGRELAGIVEAHRKAIEIAELEERIERLERRNDE